MLDSFRKLTPSRLRLGSNKGTANTREVLDFQLAHSRAKDAVHTQLQISHLKANFIGHTVIEVKSLASDRSEYLRRPDLGRKLDPAFYPLVPLGGPFHVAFVIGDGLSSASVEKHAAPVVRAIIQQLEGWSVAPIFIAKQARVAIADEIGECLGALFTVMMIGERPGLSVSSSMGIYLTYSPRRGTLDSARNCISNIHDNGGLSHKDAGDKLVWLMKCGRQKQCTGINLKDEIPVALIEMDKEYKFYTMLTHKIMLNLNIQQ